MTKSDDKRVPALRFKGFTDEWEQRKLENITKRISRKNLNLDSTLPLTISAQYGLVDQRKFFDKQIASKKLENYLLLKNGEFAYNKSYSKDYPFGAIKRLNNYKLGVLSTLYIAFKPVSINTDYLEEYFDSTKWYKEIYKRATEGARNHGLLNISPQDFFELNLSIPNNRIEQERISEILKLLSLLITLQQRKVKLINKLKNALLTHFISKTSSQSASKTLKDITNIRGGYAFKSSEFTKSGFPVIKIANISQNGEIEGPYSYVLSLKSDYQLAKNDIVLAMSGATTGKIARVNSNNIYLQNQRVGYFVNNHKIDYNYLYYLLISDQFKRQLERILISGAQPNVSASDIEKFKFVILKSKKQQSKISTLFKHIDYVLKAGNNKMHTLIQIKQFLLQNMFI
ncbi:restriction endonuclease subunit S [Lactobacillus paragasseri]|uniref:restriction endonuclease subunit S n=1 Tax=Lactobacillus paragasseri TaxID=2107999 RepID=UPI00321C3768